MKLIIGDLDSIKLRDEARTEFEQLEHDRIIKELRGKIECPECELNDPDCEGPNLLYFDMDENIAKWGCSLDECPCCSNCIFIPEFETDLEGKVLYPGRN